MIKRWISFLIFLSFLALILTACGTIAPISPTVTPVPESTLTPEPPGMDTLRSLENVIIPIKDPVKFLPTTEPPAEPPEAGDVQSFWITNPAVGRVFQVKMRLEYVTDHLYFWVEEDVLFDLNELRQLAEAFETSIYPTNRDYFGSEWTPGVDGDPHIYVLYARGIGEYAGYFSPADEYLVSSGFEASEYESNAHEIIVLSATNLTFDDPGIYAVLAHEFAHMIEWYQDQNEETWLNEGFAQLAGFLNGYGTASPGSVYGLDTDLQLNKWPDSIGGIEAQYDASYLFAAYFSGRLGPEAVRKLIENPGNGLYGIDHTLEDLEGIDPATGRFITADDVFVDWTVANYLHNSELFDGRYGYEINIQPEPPEPSEELDDCKAGEESRDVHQYGVDIIRITCPGEYIFHFAGDTTVKVIPANTEPGGHFFWSNLGTNIKTTLTRTFDVKDYSDPINLEYKTWFDLVEYTDYAAVETVIGGDWVSLLTSANNMFIAGTPFGWSYALTSGGDTGRAVWMKEWVAGFREDLDTLKVQFTYFSAGGGNGFAVDDFALPEIGYFTDFEEGNDGWEAVGFVRIENILPQTFRLTLITKGTTTEVISIPLLAANTADIPIRIGGDVEEAILLISGTTRFTNEPAYYTYQITTR